MATVLLDRVEGSSGQTGLQQSRLTRVAFVYDIDTTSAPAVLVNSVAAAGMPQIGNQHPAAPGLHVVGHDVRPTGPSQCFVLIFYETLSSAGGAAEEHLVIRDTTTLSQETTQLLPVSMGLMQLRVSLEDDVTPGALPSDDADAKVATVTYPVPLRNRVLYGVFRSRRPKEWRQCVRKVNKETFLDLKPGYWLCTYYDETWSDVDGKYRVTIGFTTKSEEDWSTYSVARETNGEYHNVPQSVTTRLRTQNYDEGIRNANNGLLKVGLYKTAPFQTIFGRLVQEPNLPGKFNGSGF